MASILESATGPATDGALYETVREPKTDPDAENVTYAVERRVSDGSLHLVVTTARKDKEDRVKRIPLRPVGRAMSLGLLD